MTGFPKWQVVGFAQEFSWGVHNVHQPEAQSLQISCCRRTDRSVNSSICNRTFSVLAGRLALQWSTFNLINFPRWQNWVVCRSLLGDLTSIQRNLLWDNWNLETYSNMPSVSPASWAIAINNICHWPVLQLNIKPSWHIKFWHILVTLTRRHWNW